MPTSDEARAVLARGELVGLPVRIAASADPTLVGREGTVVDETLGTFTIEGAGRRFVVAKAGQTFLFTDRGTEVLIEGGAIAFRPEDRIKKARVKR